MPANRALKRASTRCDDRRVGCDEQADSGRHQCADQESSRVLGDFTVALKGAGAREGRQSQVQILFPDF